MLNYSKASWAGTAKVKGSGPILLDDVACRGSEKSLENCINKGWGMANCNHAMDVGIVCENLSKGDKHVLKLFFTQ
jgi:hypothetical protein